MRSVPDSAIHASPLRPSSLAHIGIGSITWEALEFLGVRVETHYRIGRPVGEPHFVVGVHPDSIGARFSPGSFHCFQPLATGS